MVRACLKRRGHRGMRENVEATGSNIQWTSVNAGRLSNVHQIAAFAACVWVPDRVDALQRGRVPINELKDFLESVDVRHHGESPDIAAGVGLQEGAVVLERHAAVGITVRAEHVGVGKQATAAKHL